MPSAIGRGSPAAPVATAQPTELPVRLMTFNIKSASGAHGGRSRPEVLQDIADFITRENPDVVALQEVDRNTRRSGGVDQLAELARLTGASDFQFVAAMERQGGEYGVGLLLRNGFTFDDGAGERAVRRESLPRLGAVEPRAAAVASIQGPEGQAFTMLTSHLSLSPLRVAPRQVEHLAGIAEGARASGPVVVAGDFNLGPGASDPRMAQAGLVDAFERSHQGGERPKTNLTGGIDHVYVSPEVRVTNYRAARPERVHPTTGGAIAHAADWLFHEKVSDHDALVTDLVLPAKPT